MPKATVVLLVLLSVAVSLTSAAPGRGEPKRMVGHFTPEPEPDGYLISFANGFTIDTRNGEPSLPERYRIDEATTGKLIRIIQFNGPLRQEWIRQLARMGVRTFGYLPHYAVMANLDAAQCAAVRSLPNVTWVGIFQAAYKLEDKLLNPSATEKITLEITPGEDAAPVQALILQRGGKLDGSSVSDFGTTLYATVDAGVILDLARMREVIWIQQRTQPTLCNDNAQWVTQTGYRGTAPTDTDQVARRIWQKGVRGQRIILGNTDTGCNVYSPGHNAFRDSNYSYSAPAIIPEHRKVVAYKTNQCSFGTATMSEYTYHGSHTCGSICGDDAYYGGSSYYDGMAIKARLYFVDIEDGSGTFCTDNDLTELWDTVFAGRGEPDSAKPKQESSSWGWSNGSGTYLTMDASTDAYLWKHKDCLILMAAGNEGLGRRTLRNPGIAKDVITVGATQNSTASNTMTVFSSIGPTQDGRIKPTVVDPGDGLTPFSGIASVTASPNTNTYALEQGTSMATPICNGSVGLIRCYLKQGYYPSGAANTADTFGYISAALMRSLTIVSTDPNIASYDVPNDTVGFGRIDLDSVLYFTGDTRKLMLKDDTVGVATGAYAEYQFHVEDAAVPLRVALAWTDSAAAPNANPTLINDLNLYLLSPSGTYYRGNQYTAGVSTPNPAAWDNRNTEEVARVDAPAVGDWTLRVYGNQVVTARQPYAYAVTGAISDVSTTHDVGATKIIVPTGVLDSGTAVTPACSVYNYGTSAETFNVRMKIGGTYNATAQVTNLAPATKAYATFGSWTALVRGSNAVSCSTELTGDLVTSNDRVTGTVTVNAHDVGCLRIVAPSGNIALNTVVTPACTVYNYGTTAETYDVVMKIGAGYTNTATVTNHAAGAGLYLIFPDWTAAPVGTYAVSCSTQLAVDGNRANDKATGSVTVATHDVGATRIVVPTGVLDSGTTVTPACTVYNYGSSTETFNVRMKIGGTYNATATVTNLPAAARAYAVFGAWTALVRGSNAVSCSTELTGDVVTSNDKVTGTVQVNAHDVGCTDILAPAGNVGLNTVVTPACTVYNYGTTAETYNVLMRIGGVYSTTATVTAQAAGASLYLTFPDWTATPVGAYAVACSTELAVDGNRANDKATGSVTVAAQDVGATRIVAPAGSLDSGATVTPACSVYNYSASPQTFTVRMKIGGTYNATATVTSLPPATRAYATFTDWTVLVRGSIVVTCSTELTGDQIPSNDKVTDTVQVNAHDVACTRILAPAGTIALNTVVTPACSVYNYGTTVETYTVVMKIGSVYADTGTIMREPAGYRMYLTFANWTAAPVGTYAVSCSTQLAVDENHDNDRALGSVTVGLYDIGVVGIVAPPGSVDSGATIVPQANVRNNGGLPVTCNVQFTIGAGYTDTQPVTNLAPGANLLLSFAPWTAVARGAFPARCTTLLAGDNVDSNDVATELVNVDVHDAGATAILAPAGALSPGLVTPSAVLHNWGTAREALDAFFTINAAPPYLGTINLPGGLPVGVDTTVQFSSWTAIPGAYLAKCSTSLAGDQIPVNDAVSNAFSVGTVDAGVSRIISPVGSCDTSAGITPVAEVRNFGDAVVSCRVWFRINDGGGALVYRDSADVASLVAGDSTSATFSLWSKPHAVGLYTAACSTGLTGDADHSNDAAYGGFAVTVAGADVGWIRKSDVLPGRNYKRVKVGGCLAFESGTDGIPSIYALKGNGTYEFLKYNTLTNTWATAESIPAIGSSGRKKGVKQGATLTGTDGGIYAAKGNNGLDFWMYQAGHTPYPWVEKAAIPAGARTVKDGASATAVTVGGTTYVYFLKGGGTNEFYRFNTSTNTWSTLAGAPSGISGRFYKAGSAITSDGSSIVYALKGQYNEFYEYRVDSNSWRPARANLPLIGASGRKKKAGAGAGLAWDGVHVYALKGNNTQEFWAYEEDSNRWTQKADMPIGTGKRVNGGGALVSGGVWGQAILWALKGNNTLEFWQYVPSYMVAGEVTPPLPATMSGSLLVARTAPLVVTPNPFAHAATISYSLPRAGNVRLTLYDVTGKLVNTLVNGYRNAGTSSFILQPSTLSRGIYLLKLESDNTTTTSKLIIQ